MTSSSILQSLRSGGLPDHVVESFFAPLIVRHGLKPWSGVADPIAVARGLCEDFRDDDLDALQEAVARLAARFRHRLPPAADARAAVAAARAIVRKRRAEAHQKLQAKQRRRDAGADAAMIERTGSLRERLLVRLGREKFEGWFSELQAEGVEAGQLTVSVPSRFHRTWIATHHESDLLEQARAEFGAQIGRVAILVRGEARAPCLA